MYFWRWARMEEAATDEFIYLVLCFHQVPHIIALMHSHSVIITHTVIPSSGIPVHPCLCY